MRKLSDGNLMTGVGIFAHPLSPFPPGVFSAGFGVCFCSHEGGNLCGEEGLVGGRGRREGMGGGLGMCGCGIVAGVKGKACWEGGGGRGGGVTLARLQSRAA